jgi:hypothetical protein
MMQSRGNVDNGGMMQSSDFGKRIRDGEANRRQVVKEIRRDIR